MMALHGTAFRLWHVQSRAATTNNAVERCANTERRLKKPSPARRQIVGCFFLQDV